MGERVRADGVRGALIVQRGQGRVELRRRSAEGHAPARQRSGRHRGAAGQGRRERAVADAQRHRERPALRALHREPEAAGADVGGVQPVHLPVLVQVVILKKLRGKQLVVKI